ncbi:hypothetical protein JI666_09550 [Bacillus sp. NTK071]|nr:hypothetical protein [Bacillus sp. NTK071]MBN8208988.1 hypothetical protein [Bacillus sp. NTK071]
MKISTRKKLLAALLSTLLLGTLYGIWAGISSEDVTDTVVAIPTVIVYGGLGNFTYGLLVSILSDYVSQKVMRVRFLTAGFIHIAFGALTSLVIGWLGFFALCAAILFFIVDEWLHRKNHEWHLKLFLIQCSLVILVAVGAWQLMQVESRNEVEMNNTYLIPEGYEGTIITFYNLPGKPSLTKKDDQTIIPVVKKQFPALEGMELYDYGITLTSTKERV